MLWVQDLTLTMGISAQDISVHVHLLTFYVPCFVQQVITNLPKVVAGKIV